MSLKTDIKTHVRPSKRRKVSHSSFESEAADESQDGMGHADTPEAENDEEQSDEEIDGPSEHLEATARRPHLESSNPDPYQTMAMSSAGSSVMGMQIHDLLQEVTPNYEVLLKRLQPLVKRFRTTLENIPASAAANLSEAEKQLFSQGIRIPFPKPSPPRDVQYKFEFQPPGKVELCGSVAGKLSLKREGDICLRVTLPGSLLQEKDYLDYRVFYKRAFYLAKLASGLRSAAEEEYDLNFVLENELQLLPILAVQPRAGSETAKALKRHSLYISVCFPDGCFPLAKISPIKRCVRHPGPDQEKSDASSATPFYNSCLQELSSQGRLDRLLHESSRTCPAFLEACRLGRVWLRQRGLDSTVFGGGFGQHEWAMTSALLLQGGGYRDRPLLSERYSTLQLFKAVLQVLSEKDLTQGVSIPAAKDIQMVASEFPVLYDSSGGYNVSNKMTPSSYAVLRHYARVSLSALNKRAEDSFDNTFIHRVSQPLVQYDEVYTAVMTTKDLRSANQLQSLSKIHQVLQRALSDRVTLLTLQGGAESSWDVRHDQSTATDKKFSIHVQINAETAGRLVDHGPLAEEVEAAADFRKFWGSKSELRRFKDGTICESLVWSKETPVTQQILQHVLNSHFGTKPNDLVRHTPQLENMLQPSVTLSASDAFTVINNSYQALTSTLHQLENMPLPIRSVSPIGPALRSTPLKHPLQPNGSAPIEVLIQFESSARWPDSLPAIQYTKIAFLVKLGDLLVANDKSVTSRIGLENTASAIDGSSNRSFLDIIFPPPAATLTPICFRLRIHHDREAHLLQSALSSKSLHGSVRDTLSLALQSYKRDFLASPIHTSTLRNLVTRFSALSPTIRLLKKWLSSHSLIRHIPQEIIEIIAAHVFLHPDPWSTPNTSNAAFLRCLHLLSRWDYLSIPLIIDLSQSQDMSSQSQDDLRTRFTAWRKLDPSLNNVVWFFGSNIDSTGTVWTQNARPPRVVASRVQALATAAMELVKDKGIDMTQEMWKSLFVSPLEDFDFQLRLKRSVIQGGSNAMVNGGGKAKRFRNLEVQEEMDMERIGYNPVEWYVRDLERVFGNTALFFYDEDGGSVIAGLWKPNVREEKEWRVRIGYSTMPGQGDRTDRVQVNFRSMLNEMARLGEGIVEKVVVKE